MIVTNCILSGYKAPSFQEKESIPATVKGEKNLWQVTGSMDEDNLIILLKEFNI